MTDAADTETTEAEFTAIKTVHDALAPLPPEARVRVYQYIGSLLSIGRVPNEELAEESEVEASDEAAGAAPTFSSFAELSDAARPKTQADNALVAGYWLQVCQGQENFTAAAIQSELNQLGLKVANITSAIDTIRTSKPALVLQLTKSGKSKQARKTYKLSVMGVRRVKEMISCT